MAEPHNHEHEPEMKIKNPILDKNIPQGTGLREYLAGKEETGFGVVKGRQPKLIKIHDGLKDWPRTLMLMPPITLSEGTVKRVIPPLGLAYIGGYLESQGIPFDICDCVVEALDKERLIGEKTWQYGMSYDDIREYIKKYNPDILGLSIMYSSDLHALYSVAQIAKEINPKMIIVAGGIHLSIYPKEVLNEAMNEGVPTIDYIIRGEGEIRFAEFIKNYKAGVVDINADGLCGWHEGKMFINPQIGTIQNLDDMPLPAYHRLPMEKYFEWNVPFSPYPRGKRVMQLYTSRGCPVGCTFCSSTNFNKAYRGRSPEKIIEEIKYYQKVYNIDEIQFADDNLTFDRSRSNAFFDMLKELKLPWCTPNGTMVNTLTEEVLQKMIDSGLYQVTLSLDSGSAKTLKQFHRKPVNLQKVPDLVNYLKPRGVLSHATLVVGMPGESIADVEEGFEYAKTLKIDSIAVFIAQALPGSELYERAIADGTIDRFQARIIDTQLNLINLSNIPREYLERRVREYVAEFNQIVRTRDPESFDRKYAKHKDRLRKICIGMAHHNVDGILKAYDSPPLETIGG